MKRKTSLFLFLTHLYLLAGTPLLAALPKENNHNNAPKTSHRVRHEYLRMFDIAQRMKNYLDDEKNLQWMNSLQQLVKDNKGVVYGVRSAENINHHIELGNHLYQLALSLVLDSRVDVDDFLYSLLSDRFNFLRKRTSLIISYWATYSNDSSHILPAPPTNRHMFELMMQEEPFRTMRPFYENLRNCIIDTYTIYNCFIFEVYKNTPFSAFSKKTIHLLRASVSLHDALKNQDIEHFNPDPDIAAGYGYISTLMNKKYAKLHKLNLLTPSQLFPIAFQEIAKAELEERKFYSQWLEQTKFLSRFEKLDMKVYEAHCLKIRYIQKLSIPLPIPKVAKSSQFLYLDLTKYQAGVWPWPLPNPFANQKRKNQNLNTLPPSFFANVTFQDKNQERKMPFSEICQGTTTNNQVAKSLPDSAIFNQNNQEANQERKEEENLLTIESNPVPNPVLQPQDPRRNSIGIILNGIAENTQAQSKSITIANGLRKFHAEMFEQRTFYPIKQLKNKNQKIVDDLFHPKKECSVPFRKIKSLFTGIGGATITSRGGTHKQVKGPDGETVGGIFANGDAQTYGKKNIKYVQIYCLILGLLPSFLRNVPFNLTN